MSELTSCSDSLSETSFCDTALPYVSEIFLLDDSTQDVNDSSEEVVALLDELETEAQRMGKERPNLVFTKSLASVSTMKTLESFLEKHGPIPLEEHFTAAILRSVCSALLFLHQRKIAHGHISSSLIIFSLKWEACLVLSPSMRIYKNFSITGEGRNPLSDDVFRVGLVLFRMLTGEEPIFDEIDGSLLSPPERPFHISEEGLSLAKKMLGRVPRLRPTAGGVLYSKWLEEINSNAKKLIIF